MEEVLLNTMYDLPGRTDIGKVVIDAETVNDRVNPTLVPRYRHASAKPHPDLPVSGRDVLMIDFWCRHHW